MEKSDKQSDANTKSVKAGAADAAAMDATWALHRAEAEWRRDLYNAQAHQSQHLMTSFAEYQKEQQDIGRRFWDETLAAATRAAEDPRNEASDYEHRIQLIHDWQRDADVRRRHATRSMSAINAKLAEAYSCSWHDLMQAQWDAYDRYVHALEAAHQSGGFNSAVAVMGADEGAPQVPWGDQNAGGWLAGYGFAMR